MRVVSPVICKPAARGRALLALALSALALGGCPRPTQPTWRQPRTPALMVEALRSALWRRDIGALSLLLSHRCRQFCGGFVPRVIDLSGGSQVARWMPLPRGAANSELERASRTLIGALGVAMLSYREVQWLDLAALRARRFEGRVLLRARLSVEGVDLTGARRSDDGVIDLDIVQRSGLWRIDRFDLARVHTVRRVGRGYDPAGPQVRRAPAAREVALGSRVELRPPPLVSDGRFIYGVRGRAVVRWRVGASGATTRAGVLLRIARGRVRDLLLADLDGDGNNELFVAASESQSALYRLGGGELAGARRATKRGVDGDVVRALAADFDGDGRLDLYCARRARRDVLLRGRAAGVAGGSAGALRFAPALLGDTRAIDACAGDLDGDGALDIVVVDERGGARLVLRRGASFVVRRLPGAPRLGLSCGVGDVDGDGRLDVVIGALGRRADVARRGARDPAQPLFSAASWRKRASRARAGSVVLLSRSAGRRAAVPRFERRVVGARRWWNWVGLADQDNDGDLDLLVRIEQPAAAKRRRLWRQIFGPRVRGESVLRGAVARATLSQRIDGLWLNTWRGELVEASGATSLASRPESSGALLFDVDDDGDLDLLRGGHVTRWRGGEGDLDDPSAQHALLLELRGRSPANRQALGARVTLSIDGRTQLRVVGLASGAPGGAPGRVHFGVGQALRGEKVTVWWPGGERADYPDLPVDQPVRLVQGGGASWGDRLTEQRRRENDSPPASAPAPARAPATKPARAPTSRPAASQPASVLALLPRRLRQTLAAELRKARAGLILLAPARCTECARLCRRLAKLAHATRVVSLALGSAQPGCAVRRVSAASRALRSISPLLPAIVVIDRDGGARTSNVTFDADQLRADIATARNSAP